MPYSRRCPPVHRQRGRAPSSIAAALAVVAVLVAIAFVIARRPQPRPDGSAPVRPPATASSRPLRSTHKPQVPTPPAAPTPAVLEHRSLVVPWESAPPAETATASDTPTPPRAPTPTPRPSQCVAIRWSASTEGVRLGGILVDIDATNRCGRDLDGMSVWFLVAGYRQGALVQSVRGHLFDPLRNGGDGHATIVLPGSLDWYDHLEMTVLDPSSL
jgi:hypothetical protein